MASLSSSSSTMSTKPQTSSLSSTPVRRSVLHSSSSSGPGSRPCGSVSFNTAPEINSLDSSGHRRPSTVEVVFAPAPYYYGLVRQTIQTVAIRFGCQGRRAQALLAATVAVISYQLAISDVGLAVHRICAISMTLFSVACSFCALALYLRDSWTNTAVYVLFAICFTVEIGIGSLLATIGLDDNNAADSYSATTSILLHPVSTLGVLSGAGVACLLTPLDCSGGTLVVVLVSISRYLAATMLADLPSSLRPLLGYAGGLVGVIVARYIETRYTLLLAARVHLEGTACQNSTTVTSTLNQYGKVPDIKRRRSSSAVANSNSSHSIGRRISLPTLVHKAPVRDISLTFCVTL